MVLPTYLLAALVLALASNSGEAPAVWCLFSTGILLFTLRVWSRSWQS